MIPRHPAFLATVVHVRHEARGSTRGLLARQQIAFDHARAYDKAMASKPFQFSLSQMLCSVAWICVAVWAAGKQPLSDGTCVSSMIMGPVAVGLVMGTLTKRAELGLVMGIASLPCYAILMYVRAGLSL